MQSNDWAIQGRDQLPVPEGQVDQALRLLKMVIKKSATVGKGNPLVLDVMAVIFVLSLIYLVAK